MRTSIRAVAALTLLATSALACGTTPSENDESSSSDLMRRPVGPIGGWPPIVIGPTNPPPPPPSLYVGDEDDPASVLTESDVWYQHWITGQFPSALTEADSLLAEAAWIHGSFTPTGTPGYWEIGRRTSALVQMYDLMAPRDVGRARVYLERLRVISSALLDERDDKRSLSPDTPNVLLSPTGQPYDAFREQVMPAWGALTANRDGRWNTDVVTSGLFLYAMAAFSRRVTDDSTLQGLRGSDNLRTYAEDAIRFTTAALETYESFRPELHLTDSDPEAYFKLPQTYDALDCYGDESCQGYKDTAGQALAWNENLSMMKALTEVSLASDSALYRSSGLTNPRQVGRGTVEAPLLVSKDVQFFVDNLQTVWVDGGSDGEVATYLWNHQKPTARIQDTAHAQFELGSFAVIFENKGRLDALLSRNGQPQRIPISTTGLGLFANTLLHRTYQLDSDGSNVHYLDTRVDGGKDHNGNSNSNGECAGFLPLSQVNYWVWKRCRDLTFAEPNFLHEDNHAALLRYRQ